MSRKNRCHMEGCTREVGHKESGLCKACYAFLYYWKNKSVTQRINHTRKLAFWDQRAQVALLPKKVSTIRKKRRRTA